MTLAAKTDGNTDLATLKRGFSEPVFGAQRVFRHVLDAMSMPGRVHDLAAVDAAVQAPDEGFGLAMTLSLLTLLDAESPLHLSRELASPASAAYFRFHCGAQLAGPHLAQFTAARAELLGESLWQALPLGSDEQPQLGGSLIFQGFRGHVSGILGRASLRADTEQRNRGASTSRRPCS